VVQVTSPDESCSLLFMGVPANALEQAATAIEAELKKAGFTNFTEGKTEQATLNGMTAVQVDGTAQYEGVTMEIGSVIVVPGGENALMMLGFSAANQPAANVEAYTQMMASITKL